MPLPILETPKFETVIPSTRKKIEFRPYLVKEEKILMMAAESNDEKQMIRAMKDVIRSCTFNNVNPDDLAIFDLEYIFLKLRAKSVGETVTVKLKCGTCETFSEAQINVDEVEVTFPNGIETKKNIDLTDKVGISLRPISVRALSRIENDENNKTKYITDLLAASIEAIYDKEKVYRIEDITSEELTQFIDSLNRQQLEKIEAFVRGLPKLEKAVTFKCTKCECDRTTTLSGIQSFFA